MGKLHMYHILIFLLTWLSLSTQRPTANEAPPLAQKPRMWYNYGFPIPLAPASAYNQEEEDKNTEDSDPWSHTIVQRSSPQHDKRGFSMLARWKPFNSLGMQRTSIRNINLNRARMPPGAAANDFELLSAETRAYSRPSGQPLRWG